MRRRRHPVIFPGWRFFFSDQNQVFDLAPARAPNPTTQIVPPMVLGFGAWALANLTWRSAFF